MGQLSRGYLNSDERNVYMVAKSFIELLSGRKSFNGKLEVKEEVWEQWSKRGMITTTMKANIKKARTYLRKFIIELEENLDEEQLKRLDKRFANFEYKLIDDYTVQKLMRDITDKHKYVAMKKELFEKLVIEVTEIRCVGCKRCDYDKCEIYHALEDVNMSYVEEEVNCPYACDLSKLSEEEVKRVEDFRKRLNNKNIFLKKEGGTKDE